MAVNVASTGVFTDLVTDGTGLHIPLSSIDYGSAGTITQTLASGDYRALIRGINQTYYNFMTGTATGTTDASNFNKPSYFSMNRSNPSVASSTTLKRSYTTNFTYQLNDPLNLGLKDES